MQVEHQLRLPVAGLEVDAEVRPTAAPRRPRARGAGPRSPAGADPARSTSPVPREAMAGSREVTIATVLSIVTGLAVGAGRRRDAARSCRRRPRRAAPDRRPAPLTVVRAAVAMRTRLWLVSASTTSVSSPTSRPAVTAVRWRLASAAVLGHVGVGDPGVDAGPHADRAAPALGHERRLERREVRACHRHQPPLGQRSAAGRPGR